MAKRFTKNGPTNLKIDMQRIQVNRTPSPRPNAGRNLGKEITYVDSSGKHTIEFEKLQFIKDLGNGKYGTVAKYSYPDTNMYFAMKRIENRRTDDEISGSIHELRDLEVLMKTGDSPYTIKFYGAFFADADYWILTECMDVSIDKFYMQAHKLGLTVSEVFLSKLSYSILQALDYLKTKNIIHRDVKPSNMLINYDGTIKLCDFGISGFLQNSVAKTYIGCAPYMSPEKIRNSNGYKVESDIWSLGISLIEIATGVHPYGSYKNILGQNAAILDNESPKLPSDKFSAECCEFLDLCLKKEPEQRGSIESLLAHKFITDHQNTQIDPSFIKEVIDAIQSVKNE